MLAANAKVLKLQSELADMQRKLEGKTANELGEGSEIDLFEQLRATFEGDRIQRVGKGVNGADVIHEVIHNGRCAARSSTTPRTATPGRTSSSSSCAPTRSRRPPTTPSCPATSSPRTRRTCTTRTA